MAAIDRCFSAPSLAEVLARLRAEDPWGESVLGILRAMSPSALAWSFDIIQAGAERTLEACLQAELALTARVTMHPDFAEGVRAMIIDKDKAPTWQETNLWV